MQFDVVTTGVVCADVMVRPVDSYPDRGRLALLPILEMHAGGLAAVTAAVVSQLGGASAVIGKVGQDGFGEYLVHFLHAEGVNTDALHRVSDYRSSATVVMISGDGERTFLHHVGATAGLGEADMDYDLIARAKVFHWGGPSITPGLDGAPMGRIMQRARDLGVKTSMDTVYDGKGKWLAHIEPALPYLDVVMSSLEEARGYTGKDSPEDIADFYLGYGPEVALIKLGEGGIFVKGAEGACAAFPAHDVTPIDTTGAGDAACGGFLYGYTRGWSLEESARLANAVGGMTVQRMGGAEAIGGLDAVRAFMGERVNA